MNKPRHSCRVEIFADYFQFYIVDPDGPNEAPVEWNDEDVANRAKLAPAMVVVCPIRNMTVPVDVGVWDSEPPVHFEAWQHVVEAPLLTQGRIEIQQCTNGSVACFSVEPGDYTVRVLYRGLDELSDNGLDGNDFYEIQIWKALCPGLRVIRKWVGLRL